MMKICPPERTASGGLTRVSTDLLTAGACILLGVAALTVSPAFGRPSIRAAISPTARAEAANPPEPSARAPRWELKCRITHDLRLIRIDGQWYWFMTYMVTNKTDEDQLFVPEAVLSTDAGDIIKDGEIPLAVTNELLEKIGNPLLESKTHIIGQLKVGKENAREGLLIWKAGRLEDMREVRVFIGGLSSDTQVVKDPVTGEDVTVRKNLERIYDTPGLPTADPQNCAAFREQNWIMR